MGLFGSGAATGVKTCPNCGKPLEAGKTFWKEGNHYCCEKCCDTGQRLEQKKKEKSLTCEFC